MRRPAVTRASLLAMGALAREMTLALKDQPPRKRLRFRNREDEPPDRPPDKDLEVGKRSSSTPPQAIPPASSSTRTPPKSKKYRRRCTWHHSG